MQRNYYSDRFLDEDFEQAVQSKEKKVQEKYNDKELKDIYFDNAQKINRALIDFKPNRHQKDDYRNHKRAMLEYLDKCIMEDLSNMTFREIQQLKADYTERVSTHLGHLGFKLKGSMVIFPIIGLIIDISLTILGIAKYYYYIPIIFILVTYAQLKGLYRAKKAGKLLR